MDKVLDNRKKQFKKNFDDPRRRREELQVQLRKKDREDELKQKRQQTFSESSSNFSITDFTSVTDVKQPDFNSVSPEVLADMVAGVKSNIPEKEEECTRLFRKLLSIEKNPPIQQVLDAYVVEDFVRFLTIETRPLLQFEAAWALTNIASGNSLQTKVVVDHGAVPIFIELLSSPRDDVREQAVWALGNIAGDSPVFRDLVLRHNGLPPLLEQFHKTNKFTMIRNTTWTISNMCRGKPAPSFDLVAPAIPILAGLLNYTDQEVLTDACWALSYLSDGENHKIEAVLKAGVCHRLIELLDHTSQLVQTPALRTVGNIVTGNDDQTEVILANGGLSRLKKLLNHPKKTIRKEACWTVSNITAGTTEQIGQVINIGLIPLLVHLMQGQDFEIVKEAAWAISNAASGGTAEQIEVLVESHCIPALCGLLDEREPKLLNVVLEAIENILRHGQSMVHKHQITVNPYGAIIDAAGGIGKIEALQDMKDDDIYRKAWGIIYRFFPFVEESRQDPASNFQFDYGANRTASAFDFGSS